MYNNYTSNILSQLTTAGYSLQKSDSKQSPEWLLIDNTKNVLTNKTIGGLMKEAANVFNLDWEN